MTFLLAGWGFLAIMILLHELGHAIPALWLTKDRVSVSIGIWRPGRRRLHLTLNRLDIYVIANPIRWYQGICCHSGANLSIWQRIAITAGGPVVSLLVTTLSIITLSLWQPAGQLGLYALVFTAVSTLLVAGSFSGSARYFDGTNMRKCPNDAAKIIELYKISRLPVGWNKAAAHYQKREFVEAAEILDRFLSEGRPRRVLVRYAMAAHINAKQYGQAMAIHERFRQRFKPDAYDYTNLGVLHSHQGRQDEALRMFRKAMDRSDRIPVVVHNYGYGLGQAGKHDQAIIHLDRAIALMPGMADAFSNRAYSHLHLGNFEEAFRDLTQSLSLDESSAETHAYLGWYHWHNDDVEAAEECFKRAAALDPEMALEKYRSKIQMT